MKKLFLLFSIASLILTGAKAQTTEIASGNCGAEGDGTNLTWSFTSDSTLTISGSGAMKDYENSFNNYSPAPWDSYYRDKIKTLIIGDSVTTIGNLAFYVHRNLETPEIPASVTSIGESAFSHCSSLAGTLTIPKSVTNIGDGAFIACTALTSIDVDTDNPNYSSIDGILYDKAKSTLIYCPAGKEGALTIPDEVITIGSNAFNTCVKLTSAVIPNSITTISENAFINCSGLASVTIPNSVQTIENFAFGNCIGLTDIYVFWEMPINIHTTVFYDVETDDINLHIPYGTKSKYNNTSLWWIFNLVENDPPVIDPPIVNPPFADTGIAWGYCGGEGSVGDYNGNTTNLAWKLTADSVLVIEGSGAMYDYNCYSEIIWPVPWEDYKDKIKTLDIGDSVTTIGCYAFYKCQNITGTLTFSNSLTNIGQFAFDSCIGLTGMVIIPNSVRDIGDYAFVDCHGLTSIIIGDTNIDVGGGCIVGMRSIFECYGLTSLYIGSNVSFMNSDAIGFYDYNSNCKLKDIHVFWTTPMSISHNPFTGIPYPTTRLHIPEGTLEAYKNAPVWQYFLLPPFTDETEANESVANADILQIYPNPTSGVVYIDGVEDAEVSVYTLGGRLVERFNGNSIDLSAQPAGVYVLRMGNKSARVVKK